MVDTRQTMHFWKSIKRKWLTDTQSRSWGRHLLWICGKPRRLKFKWIHWLQVYMYVPIFTSIVHAFVCSRIEYCKSLLIGLPKTRLSPLQTVSPPTSRNLSIGFQSLLALNIKCCLLFLRPKWGWHLNISVTPSNFLPLPHPFVLYAPWKAGAFCPTDLDNHGHV